MSKQRDLQKIIHHYRRETGIEEVDMRLVAEWAVKRFGMELPPPVDPYDQLAKQFSRAAREESAVSKMTGRPYRVNHAIPSEGGQGTLWVHIDHANPVQMKKSVQKRRAQMVGDATQLALDLDHYNRSHPDQEPITVNLDFTEDAEERMNAIGGDDDFPYVPENFKPL